MFPCVLLHIVKTVRPVDLAGDGAAGLDRPVAVMDDLIAFKLHIDDRNGRLICI